MRRSTREQRRVQWLRANSKMHIESLPPVMRINHVRFQKIEDSTAFQKALFVYTAYQEIAEQLLHTYKDVQP